MDKKVEETVNAIDEGIMVIDKELAILDEFIAGLSRKRTNTYKRKQLYRRLKTALKGGKRNEVRVIKHELETQKRVDIKW